MFQSAKDAYNFSDKAYSYRKNKSLIVHLQASIDLMEEAATNSNNIEIIGQFAIFLHDEKNLKKNYEKMAKYLKKAAIEGDNYECLSYYLQLVDDGKVDNKNHFEIGQLFERLQKYEQKQKNKKKQKNISNWLLTII